MLAQPRDVKPLCNAKMAGRFWPATAETSAKSQRKLAQDGELEVCVCRNWRYKWRPVTVNVHRLEEARK